MCEQFYTTIGPRFNKDDLLAIGGKIFSVSEAGYCRPDPSVREEGLKSDVIDDHNFGL